MPIPNKSMEVKYVGKRTVDLEMTEGHVDTIEGKEEWLQANKLGLISQEGDWRFDPAEGLPWLDHPALSKGRFPILGRTPPIDEELIELYIYQQLNKDARNEVVRNIDAEWQDIQSRTVSAQAEIIATDGVEGTITDEISTK